MCFDLYIALDNCQKLAHMTKEKTLIESVALMLLVMEYVEENKEDIALILLTGTQNITARGE